MTAPANPTASDSRSISPAALGLLAVWIGSGAAMALLDQPPEVLSFVFIVSGWVLAVAVHEFGHAWTAWKAGDHTVEAKGYLTLNPFKYTNVMMSVVIPVAILAIGGIGFPGGAVYLRQDLMRSRLWRAAASLAGPVGTLLVLLLLSLLFGFVARTGATGPLAAAIAFLAFLQATALILNLLPVPGLDGYGVIRPFLPTTVRSVLVPFERVALLALIALVFWVPGVARELFGAAFELMAMLGVPRDLVIDGLRAFQFWK